MLETRTAASGASGRNGGPCRPGWWLDFKEYVKASGEEEAVKLENLEEQNVQDIVSLVHEHGVDCDFKDVETADALGTEKTWENALDILETSHDVGKGTRLVKRRALQGKEADGLKGLLAAVVCAAHTQNPLRPISWILELCLKRA